MMKARRFCRLVSSSADTGEEEGGDTFMGDTGAGAGADWWARVRVTTELASSPAPAPTSCLMLGAGAGAGGELGPGDCLLGAGVMLMGMGRGMGIGMGMKMGRGSMRVGGGSRGRPGGGGSSRGGAPPGAGAGPGVGAGAGPGLRGRASCARWRPGRCWPRPGSRAWRADWRWRSRALIFSRWSGFTLSRGRGGGGAAGAGAESAARGPDCLYTWRLWRAKQWSEQKTDSPLSGLERCTLLPAPAPSHSDPHMPHLQDTRLIEVFNFDIDIVIN